MLKRTLSVVVSGLALGVVLSTDSPLAAEMASIQFVLNEGGGGVMVANSQTNPEDETWSWEACDIGLKACTPLTQGRVVSTAGASIPSVFRATSSHGATALSPRWNGPVRAVAPPSASGTVRANEIVLPLPGRWRGGWAGDSDWTQLAACEGLEDKGCTTLTDMHYVGGCRNGAAVIDPKFTGMYLRVADQRVTATTGMLDYGRGSPYTPYIWGEGPTVSVAVVGRIKPATGEPATGCGPPLIEAAISKRGMATVRCEISCRATLIARQGRRRARVFRTVAPGQSRGAASALQLRAGQLRGFESESIHFLLRVDGWRVAARTVSREEA